MGPGSQERRFLNSTPIFDPSNLLKKTSTFSAAPNFAKHGVISEREEFDERKQRKKGLYQQGKVIEKIRHKSRELKVCSFLFLYNFKTFLLLGFTHDFDFIC